ncbi:FtsK/SpoIIIE domain-containing protein [Streptomyces sp. NPDC056683]|uniref:FtsK/SpoIIIE domain-containing protein n=1 Tax=Streptomyces sp. NPDC056683 TaxID=3345910 RepID=UPI0036A6B896
MSFDLEPARVTTMTTKAAHGVPAPRSRRSEAVYVSSSSSSSSLSSRPSGWTTAADYLVRSGNWIIRRRYELIPVSTTSALTGLGLEQQTLGAIFGYGALSAVALTFTALGVKNKSEHVTRYAGGAFFALADIAFTAGFGLSWATITAWALSTGLGYWMFGPWLTAQRNTRIKLNVDTVKAKGAVQGALGIDAADPGLIGSSAEETALRRAIHALTGVTPQDVPAFTHTDDGGFVARVRMPAGRNTSPDAIIRRRPQLAANLGMAGELQLTKVGPDEILVRLTTRDALAGTIPYSDDGGQSIKDPLRLGFDEYGDPVMLRMLYRHTLIAGASDWGKSGIVNLIIKRLARRIDVDIYGIDMKPGSVELGPWEPLMKRVAKGPEEARDLIDYLERKSADRGNVLARISRENLARGLEPVRKWVPGEHVDSEGDSNAIVVITDELAELVRQDEQLRRIEAEARKMAMRGRGADVDLEPPAQPIASRYESRLAIDRFNAMTYVSSTQQPSRKVFGGNTDARGNYANRISTRTGESGHAPFIFGSGCQSKGWRPEELDKPGEFLIATPEAENEKPRRCRAEYVTDEDIAADVGHLHARAFRGLDEPDVYVGPAPAVTVVKTLSVPPAYPDGVPVAEDEFPDLYRVFQRLGSATKEELTRAGRYSSRDTVRRALETWAPHGLHAVKDGRATRYFLHDPEEDQ